MAQTIEDVESRTLLQQFHALYKRQNDTDDEIDTIKGNIDNLEDEIERLDTDVIELEKTDAVRITDLSTGIYKLTFSTVGWCKIYYDGNGSNYKPIKNGIYYLFVIKTNDGVNPLNWKWHLVNNEMYGNAFMSGYTEASSGSCAVVRFDNGKTYDLDDFLTSDDIGDVFTLKGSVATVSDLPASNNNYGDVYYVIAESVGYVWIHDTTTNTDRWEQLGLAIDLSNYVTQSELSTALNGKQNNLTAGNGIDITGDTISAEITEDEIDSGEATSGQVLTADGSGGASWQNPQGSLTSIYEHNLKLNCQSQSLTIYLSLIISNYSSQLSVNELWSMLPFSKKSCTGCSTSSPNRIVFAISPSSNLDQFDIDLIRIDTNAIFNLTDQNITVQDDEVIQII